MDDKSIGNFAASYRVIRNYAPGLEASFVCEQDVVQNRPRAGFVLGSFH
jgi:hypothetical protein